MRESVMKRVGRIVSGSFNSIVCAIENAAPETVMEETLREIDGAIEEVRGELGKAVANKHLANSRLMGEKRKHEDLAEKIEIAVTQGRDDLAETAIARQLEMEAQFPVLETTINECSHQEKELESYIAALQVKKRQMKDELRLYRESGGEGLGKSAASARNSSSSTEVERKVSKAESAFERVMENTTGISAAGTPTNRKTAVHMAELEVMARKNKIQERLAAVKGERKENSDV